MVTLESLGIKPVKSGRYSTTCPKCSPNRKPENRKKECLTVNNQPGDQWWNCNNPGCEFRGNLATYGKFDKVREASRMPAVKPSIYSPKVNEYLASRQISPEIALKRGVYEVKNAKGNPVICYPYYYNRSLVNVMFRNIVFDKAAGEIREWQISKDKGTVTCFWGMELLDFDRSKDVIITEGQTDAMTWDMCGYPNVLSIPMGASMASPEAMKKKLEFATDESTVKLLENARRIYVFMDNDDAGKNFAKALAEVLGKERCWLAKYPTGYKDSNEVYAGDAKKNLDPLGKTGIDKIFETAYPFPMKGIITVSMVMEELNKIANDGFKRGLLTGNEDIDKLISLKQGTLIGMTGIPSFGKSVTLRYLLTEYVKKNSFLEFAGYTPESRPVSREYAKIAEIVAGQRFESKWHNGMNEEKRRTTLEYVEKHFTLVNPEVNNFEIFGKKMDPRNQFAPKGLRSILGYMKYLKETKGIFGFWIDAWNKLDHQRPSSKPIEEFISQELDYLLEFLDREQLLGIVIAHPTKMERIRGGNYRIPSLYDMKGSSAWNEKLDIGLISHRNMYQMTNKKDPDTGDDIWELNKNAPTDLICEKMKFDELGEVGKVRMWMDKTAGDRFVFSDPNKGDGYEEKKQKSKKKEAVVIGEPMEADDDSGNPFIAKEDLPF